MRPPKTILYISDSEDDLSLMRMLLWTHGYHVLTARGEQTATSIFVNETVDLVLADYEMRMVSGDKIVARLKKIAPYIPMILLGDPLKMNDLHGADALLVKRTCSTFDLLERIKIMSARKRGPRKGSPSAMRCGKVA